MFNIYIFIHLVFWILVYFFVLISFIIINNLTLNNQMYLDIDECKIKSEGTSCTNSSTCKNTIGGFVCECLSGYSQNGTLSNKTVCVGKFFFYNFSLLIWNFFLSFNKENFLVLRSICTFCIYIFCYFLIFHIQLI